MKITRETTVKDIYVNSPAIKYKKNLFYGWDLDNDNRKLGELVPEVWPIDDMVNCLNKLEELDQKGYAELIQFDKNPDINFIALRHKDNRKCALVYAGGGYCSVCNLVEAFPVAMYLYKKGFDTFTGTYAINNEARNGKTIDDVSNGIKYLIDHQKELLIDMDGYIIGGFSAGGHAVGELLTDNLGLKTRNIPMPKEIFLGYPVIDTGINSHCTTRKCLLGDNPTQKEMDKYSIQKHLSDCDTKVYFWQCKNDDTISLYHTVCLEEALKKTNIKYIYHQYDSTAHGWGIATGKLADGWVDEMIEFGNK